MPAPIAPPSRSHGATHHDSGKGLDNDDTLRKTPTHPEENERLCQQCKARRDRQHHRQRDARALQQDAAESVDVPHGGAVYDDGEEHFAVPIRQAQRHLGQSLCDRPHGDRGRVQDCSDKQRIATVIHLVREIEEQHERAEPGDLQQPRETNVRESYPQRRKNAIRRHPVADDAEEPDDRGAGHDTTSPWPSKRTMTLTAATAKLCESLR